MKKNTVYEYIFALISILVVLVLTYVLAMGDYYQRDNQVSEVIDMTHGWTLETEEGITAVSFPLNVDIRQGEKAVLHYMIDEQFDRFHFPSIRFYRYYADMVVNVGNTIVSIDVNDPESISNTSGTTDLIIPVPYGHKGDNIDIELTGTINGNYTYNFPVPQLGERSVLFTQAYATFPPAIIFNLFLITIGMVVFVLGAVFNKIENSDQFITIGLFSLFVGIYMTASTRWFHSIVPNTYFAYVLEYTFFTVSVWPVLTSIKKHASYNVSRFARYVLNYQIVVFLYNYIALFVFGIELTKNLRIIQLGVVMTIVVVVVNAISSIRNNLPEARRISVSFMPLSLCIIIDLLLYYFFRNADSIANFSMLGILLYIILQLYFAYDNHRKSRIEKERAEIYRQLAFTDPLTGVSSRLAYEEELCNIESSLNSFRSIWAATIDVNDLKYYNDTYGHYAGDKVLKEVTAILVHSVKKGDFVFRTGGDEFVLFMKNYSDEDIDAHYKSIRAATKAVNEGKEFKVKYAVGYCKYDSDVDQSFEDTIRRSDTLMYNNKKYMKNNDK